MLRPGGLGKRSPLGYAADPVPCVQCDRRERGLAWGDFCTICREEREREAKRVGSRIGILGAAILAAYLIWQTPNELMPRIFAAASVLLLYVIIRVFVSKLRYEFAPRRPKAGRPADVTDGEDR
ncbi:MAG: hypothetical protein AB7R55_17880 [Gemmatimonadales bacterium]